MNGKCWLGVLGLIGTATTLYAEPLLFGRNRTSTACPPPCFSCPNDYCPKPMPCVRPAVGCRLADDYCAKPIPLVPCRNYDCGRDDYCAKPFPRCLPPSLRPWYSCGPTACSCATCSQK